MYDIVKDIWRNPGPAYSLMPLWHWNALPEREELAMVWRYLQNCQSTQIHEEPGCLCRKIVRWSGKPLGLAKLLTCLRIFADVGLIGLTSYRKNFTISLQPAVQKADLQQSETMQKLQAMKEA